MRLAFELLRLAKCCPVQLSHDIKSHKFIPWKDINMRHDFIFLVRGRIALLLSRIYREAKVLMWLGPRLQTRT
jgi:hypothetical protein